MAYAVQPLEPAVPEDPAQPPPMLPTGELSRTVLLIDAVAVDTRITDAVSGRSGTTSVRR